MFNARIRMPAEAKKGEVVDIRTIAQHPMTRGGRNDATGVVTPRRILHRFVATYDGAEIFRMELGRGIASNPYIAFSTVATTTGDVEFKWFEDGGEVFTRTVRLTVA